MGAWTVAGVDLEIPEAQLDATLRRVLARGWYEAEERRALEAHLAAADRVLDIGGGAGFLAVCAARVVGAGRVATIEANPAMLPVLGANLARNGAEAVTVEHGAVLAGAAPGTEHPLALGTAFWQAAATDVPPDDAPRVPALALDALLARHAPTVLLVDVEGAEADYFATTLPACLRLIVLELHPSAYPRRTVAALFARLAAQDFAYQPRGSAGAVVVLERLAD